MSNETTNPVVKWILIGVIVVSFCVVGALFLIGAYPAEEYRVARELESRGFEITYEWVEFNIWKYPIEVVGSDLIVTEDDSRLICQLPHLFFIQFHRCDLAGLSLDDIGNCRDLHSFHCDDVTRLPADEIRRLVAYVDNAFVLTNAGLNDSNMADFAKSATVECLYFYDNTEITDAGLEYLEKIASLRYLGLTGTSITKEGVDEFKKKRPDVYVYYDGMP